MQNTGTSTGAQSGAVPQERSSYQPCQYFRLLHHAKSGCLHCGEHCVSVTAKEKFLAVFVGLQRV